jgi:hypothetical protein
VDSGDSIWLRRFSLWAGTFTFNDEHGTERNRGQNEQRRRRLTAFLPKKKPFHLGTGLLENI